MRARTLLLAAALISAAALAHAQSVCDQRAKFVTDLGRKYKEAPVAFGLTANGKLLEVLSSGTGSWTMIVTSTDGTSCAVAAGQSWSKVAPDRRDTAPYYIF